ncbi:MAG: hypothetical protein LQ352_007627 [Teloschistes flavicans]|nr:MAG: hypothetical protein LQ352_007627 [Teloschistes flavicans]
MANTLSLLPTTNSIKQPQRPHSTSCAMNSSLLLRGSCPGGRTFHALVYLAFILVALHAYSSTALFIAQFPYAPIYELTGIGETFAKIFLWMVYAGFYAALFLVMPLATCWVWNHHPWVWALWMKVPREEGGGKDCEMGMGWKGAEWSGEVGLDEICELLEDLKGWEKGGYRDYHSCGN